MLIVYLCIFWLIGIGLASQVDLRFEWWLIACLISFIGSAVWQRRDPKIAKILVCLAILAAGGVRYVLSSPTFSPQHVMKYNDNPRTVTMGGLVVAEPDVRDRFILLQVEVYTLTIKSLEFPDGYTEDVVGRILVNAPRFPEIEYGSRIELTGKLKTPAENNEFSYKEYLAQEGIFSVIYLPKLTVVAEGEGNPFLARLFAFKAQAMSTIDRLLPAPESAVLRAVLLGNDNGLPEELYDAFRTAGVSHLIVISGFHTAILALALIKMTTPLGRKSSSIVTSAILIFYTLLVGANPSVVRATLMAIAYLIGSQWFGRKLFTVGLIAGTALVMTIFDPFLLWKVGFQLSFMATLSIILYANPLEEWTRRVVSNRISVPWANQFVGTLLSVVTVSMAAQILTLPLIIYHFKQISLVALLANFLLVPIQPILMILGTVMLLVGMAIEPLGMLLGRVEWLFLAYTVQVVYALARIPMASVSAELPHYLPIVELKAPFYTLVTLYTAIAGASWWALAEGINRRVLWQRSVTLLTRPILAGMAGIGTLLIFAWHNGQPDGLLHVTFFDVGQGDAILIVSPTGRKILIDGGYFPSMIEAHLGRTLPFWDNKIDIVIATHPDADHITGLPELFDRYEVKQLVLNGNVKGASDYYDEMLERAELNKVSLHRAMAGETIEVGDGLKLEIVHPGNKLDEESKNNNSISTRLIYGDFKMLLTGDAEKEAEREMLESGLPLQADILKVGHHGSRTSSTAEFLRAVRPKIAIVSAGVGNNFGHPHPDVMRRYGEINVAVLDTRCLGSIAVITDGSTMWWESYNRRKESALSCNKPEWPSIQDETPIADDVNTP